MKKKVSAPDKVVVHSWWVSVTEEKRPEVFVKAGRVASVWLERFGKRYGIRFEKVFVQPDERCAGPGGLVPVRRPRPGFSYALEKRRKGLELFVDAEYVRSKAAKRSDAELVADIVELSQLMIERLAWQLGLGTYRSRHPKWETRVIRTGSVFSGLVKSQKAEINQSLMSGSSGHELVVRCPRCQEHDWPSLMSKVEALLEKSKSLQLEDAGYIVPKRMFEFTLVGTEARLKAFVAKLKPVFEARRGTTAVLRRELSEAKGRLFKLA